MSQSEERGKWRWVRDAYEDTARITNPAGTQYEISLSRLCDLDRGLVALLGDAIDGGYGLISLQAENEALRKRIVMLEAASGADVTNLAAAANAAKAAREADAAGYKAVIAELRAEVARLTGGVDCKDEVLRLADDYAKTAWLDGRVRKSLNDILFSLETRMQLHQQALGKLRKSWRRDDS